MYSNGPEVAGEDYRRNKEKDRRDALEEQIDGLVGDCKIAVVGLLRKYYNDDDPGWNRIEELYNEARGRIKKYL